MVNVRQLGVGYMMWITKAGLMAKTVDLGTHFCGYVKVDEDHPLHGVNYFEYDNDYKVHGGITFADSFSKLDTTWWIGFDGAHAGDTKEVENEEFMMNECEKLAGQLV